MKIGKLLSILLVLFSFQSKSQSIQDIGDRISASDFIFEGKIIRANSYWNQAKTYIYTSLTIKITKTFKGNIDCGTIELITEGGTVGDKSLDISHNLTLGFDQIGIFMCKKTDKELPLVDFYPETNSIKLESKFDEKGFIEYFNDNVNKIAVDHSGLSFDSLAQVYDVLEYYTQITYVDCYPGTTLFESHKKISPSVGNNEINVIYKSEEEGVTQREITYTIQNGMITTTGSTHYFEFDISFSDNENSIYFAGGAVYLAYDTAVFGPNIALNSNNQITRGTVTQSTTTFSNPYFSNGFNDTTLLIVITRHQPVTTSSVFYELTTTPTDAAHLKLEIIDCNAIGSILPIVPSIHTIYSTVQVNPSSYSNYNAILVANSITINGCGLNIYGISPTSVRAGVGDVLTITGSGFGNSRGSGLVYLKNADNGGISYMPVDSMDYISWTSNQIQFYVPSIADSMNVNKHAVGSGRIIVKTDSGLTTTPTLNDSLTIRFSADNKYTNAGESPKEKYFVNLVNPPNENGYIFRMDTNFSRYPDRLSCLRHAIKSWTCLTSVNFQLGTELIIPNDTLLPASSEGINNIKFAKLPGGVLARTYTWGRYNRNACEKMWTYEIDFVASKDSISSFFCDTSIAANLPAYKYDFYHILLHELGHAHSLKHVNNPTQVMYFEAIPFITALPAAERMIQLISDASCIEGGYYVVNRSLTFTPSVCDTAPITIMTLDTSSNCTGMAIEVNELFKPEIKLTIYPNPSDSYLNISYSLENPSIVEFIIYDYLGIMVMSTSKKKIESGVNEVRINLSNLSSGFYIAKLTINRFQYIKKIIKQ